MDRTLLQKAIRLENELSRLQRLANKAYNSHMYLKIFLGEDNVTKEIDSKEIGEILYKHFSEKSSKIIKELDEL